MEAEAPSLLDDTPTEATQEEAAVAAPVEPVKNHLKPIIINRQKYSNREKSMYRVYTSEDEYKIVEADSAHEAYTQSGVSRAYKIKREAFFQYLSLGKDLLEKEDDPVETTPDLPDKNASNLLIDEFLANFEGKFNAPPPFEELGISGVAEFDKEAEAAAKKEAEEAKQAKKEAAAAKQAEAAAQAKPLDVPEVVAEDLEEEPQPEALAEDASDESQPEASADAAEPMEGDGGVELEDAAPAPEAGDDHELSIDEVTQLLGGKDDDAEA